MKAYLDILQDVIDNGRHRGDRTGTGTTSIFDAKFKHDMRDGFPLVTTKFTALRLVFWELMGFLNNDLHMQVLVDENVKIWDGFRVSAEQATFEFGDPSRRLVHVPPRIKENSGYYNPVSDLKNVEPGSMDDVLRKSWTGMMYRCYDPKSRNYDQYGGRGVFVCERWHTLSNYIADVKKLPNWANKEKGLDRYELDKDYYSSNCYSPDTCIWLSRRENSSYVSNSSVIAIQPNGDATLYASLVDCGEAIGMSHSSVHRLTTHIPKTLKGNNKQFTGWKFIVINAPFRYSIVREGDLNAPYGAGWRGWGAIRRQNVSDLSMDSGDFVELLTERFINPPVHDQFAYAMDLIRNNPESRRILVSAWNPGWMPDESISPQENVAKGDPCLTPCHWAFEFYTEEMTLEERWLTTKDRWNQQDVVQIKMKASQASGGLVVDGDNNTTYANKEAVIAAEHAELDKHGIPRRYLSLKWHQRSCDMFLGVPFNIASYALLLMMVAREVGMEPYMLVGDLTNVHIYDSHLEQVKLQLTREPLPLPWVSFTRLPERIEDYKWSDILLENYEYHPAIKGDIAV